MSIVTITSDLGNDNYMLAALKGTLLTKCASIHQLVDISNTIRSFDIVETAFVFSKVFRSFPKDTIHILSVNPFYSPQYQLLLFHGYDQYFIAPNNGLLPLIFENETAGEIILLDHFEDTAQYMELLAVTVNRILSGEQIQSLGKPDPELFMKITLQPVVSKNIIRGTIIHVDKFGNLISNIKKSVFEKVRDNRKFAVYFRHKDPITKISRHYHEVSIGDELCIFNMSDNLEIAINLGNASEILGLYLEDTIQIDFQ